MAHPSPPVFLLWSILTTALGVFYVYHLWHFDRFQCLNVFHKAHNAPFRRFMTFSYLLAVPLLFVYTTGFAVISYQEGYITLPSGLVIHKPYHLWTPEHQASHYPLNMIFALAWGSEAVSHLEELCFWLFVINSGASPTSWFKSIYFKIWAGGSVVSMILFPVVTAVTKNDKVSETSSSWRNTGISSITVDNDAWLQCVGSTTDLAITVAFLPVLWIFPSFVQNVKNEGADTEAVTRLAKYHDLNITRIVFRFLFVVPLLMLSIDALQPHAHIFTDSLVLSDLLAMSSSVGCVVQSVITLMIFFPRDMELEMRRWLREPSTKPPRSILLSKFKKNSKCSSVPSHVDHDRHGPAYLLTDSPVQSNLHLVSAATAGPYIANQQLAYGGDSMTTLAPHRQWTSASAVGLTEANLRVHSEATQTLYPMAHSFTSPINIDPADFPPTL